MLRDRLRWLYARLEPVAFRRGPHGTCSNCGGPMQVPYVRMECPPRPWRERLAFWVIERLHYAGIGPVMRETRGGP